MYCETRNTEFFLHTSLTTTLCTILSSRLLSQTQAIKITVLLPVLHVVKLHLKGKIQNWGTWERQNQGEQLVTEGWRKLYNYRTSKFVPSPTSSIIKSGTMRLAGHVTCISYRDTDKAVVRKTASIRTPILFPAHTNTSSTYQFTAQLKLWAGMA
jgi:hypothetical protein